MGALANLAAENVGRTEPLWHVLDCTSVPVKEFAAALGRHVRAVGWIAEMAWLGAAYRQIRFEHLSDPELGVVRFPLQRGYHRPLIRNILPFAGRLQRCLESRCLDASICPLVCTSSFYAPLAERWPGPVIYYVTDFTVAYEGLNRYEVLNLDRRMCRLAMLVCPNSQRISNYLLQQAGCEPEKIKLIPNATRTDHIHGTRTELPAEFPVDARDVERPVAGIIGNLAGNLDWELLETTIELVPWISWVFVGPTSMAIRERTQSRARDRLLKLKSQRIRFVGPKPYGVLKQYARAFDVAVLPYRKKEPTYSGSATRFYEHLAACRPMLATRGVEELLHKEPLVRLVNGPEELSRELLRLQTTGFRDGFEQARWLASQDETWDARAKAMVAAFESRMNRENDVS